MINNTTNLYIGLLSGTSIDNIDTAIYSISQDKINLEHTLSYPIDTNLKQELHSLINNTNNNYQGNPLNLIGTLNRKLGNVFSEAVLAILSQEKLKSDDIRAIGLHGQTVFHQPTLPHNFSIQLGCPNTIVERTQIPVVTDFRQRDMVNGGQGAPLAPILHHKFFHDNNTNRAIINIGGISNITILAKNLNNNRLNNFIASDLGPGNTLLDQWFQKNYMNNNETINNEFDLDGQFAMSGQLNQDLLNKLLSDPYFTKKWPKSTGREYFNLNWLEQYLSKTNTYKIQPADIQRTILELTAKIITNNITNNNLKLDIQEVYICGGGAHNKFLMQRIKELISPIILDTTCKLNIPADWVESALFAWLAYCTVNNHRLNLKYITGNNKSDSSLGCVYS